MAMILKVVAGIASTAALVSLFVYVALAVRGNSKTLRSTGNADSLSWKQNVFLSLAAIGFLVCMYTGAEALLWWIPSSWGHIDEDGQFITLRSALSGLFTASAGIFLLALIDEANRK